MQIENEISAEEYNYLTDSVGWGTKNIAFVEKAMRLSTFKKSIKIHGKTVAMGRAIGDGMTYIIADVVVDSEYQGNGYGRIIMNELLAEIKNSLIKGESCSINLISTGGKESFYEKCGFKKVPFAYNGYGMKMKIVN